MLHRIIRRFIHQTKPIDPPFKKRVNNKKLVLASLGLGSAIGSVGAWNEYKRGTLIIPNLNELNDFTLDKKPPFQPSKTVTFSTEGQPLKLTLYQYQTCPFCCKVRALLDFYGIPYDIVEVNPVLRTQIKWSTKYKKVPILIVETPEGEILQLNDSSMIISSLYSYLISQKENWSTNKNMTLNEVVKCYPVINFQEEGENKTEIQNKYSIMMENAGMIKKTKDEIVEERKWRKWADSVFVHTLSPNIYRTVPEALDSFRNFDKVGEWDKNFSNWERSLVIYVGALAMWLIGKKLQSKYNLKEDVRESLYEQSNFWMKNIKKKGTPFMGGNEPNLSDLAVFGVLNSIEGCQAFEDLKGGSKIVNDWYEKVKQHLQTKKSNSNKLL